VEQGFDLAGVGYSAAAGKILFSNKTHERGPATLNDRRQRSFLERFREGEGLSWGQGVQVKNRPLEGQKSKKKYNVKN